MRKVLFATLVLLLVAGGFLYQTRLSGTLPAMRELLPLAVGLVLFFAAALLGGKGRVRVLLTVPWVHYGLAAALLAALAVFGRRYRGGLYLPGLVNPSEFVKLFFVLFAVGHLARARAAAGRLTFRAVGMLAAAFGVLALEIALIRDFGLLAQLGLTLMAILFVASWGWGLAAAACGGAAALAVLAHPAGHLATRLAIWRDPFADATGAGWQVLQGLAALVSGGWWGKGMGLGEVHDIPIVSSDFVYVALAEEIGFAGCAVLLAVWAMLFLLALAPHIRRAASQDDSLAILAAGLVASLACQLILNVAGVLNALPMTGITLPLLSHGGSSLIAVLAMCGLLHATLAADQTISMQSP